MESGLPVCFVVNCSFTLLNVMLMGAWRFVENVFVCMPTVMWSCKACRDGAPTSSHWIEMTHFVCQQVTVVNQTTLRRVHTVQFFSSFTIGACQIVYDMTPVRFWVKVSVHFHKKKMFLLRYCVELNFWYNNIYNIYFIYKVWSV